MQPDQAPENAAGYSPAEREAIETRGAAGGVVAYIHRLSDGHRFTFTDSLGIGVCTCGDVLCKGPYIALHRAELIASYEAKVQDLARETLRTSALAAVVRRLYHALGVAWNGGDAVLEHQRHRFFDSGMPPDERAAMEAVLRDEDVAWLRGEPSE